MLWFQHHGQRTQFLWWSHKQSSYAWLLTSGPNMHKIKRNPQFEKPPVLSGCSQAHHGRVFLCERCSWRRCCHCSLEEAERTAATTSQICLVTCQHKQMNIQIWAGENATEPLMLLIHLLSFFVLWLSLSVHLCLCQAKRPSTSKIFLGCFKLAFENCTTNQKSRNNLNTGHWTHNIGTMFWNLRAFCLCVK